MRNIFLTLAFVAIIFSTMSFYGASPVVLKMENGVFVLQDEYKVVKITELPMAVTDAVSADFPDATIVKGYINESKEYKLELTMDGTMQTVYLDATGKWINKE